MIESWMGSIEFGAIVLLAWGLPRQILYHVVGRIKNLLRDNAGEERFWEVFLRKGGIRLHKYININIQKICTKRY